MRTPVFPLIIPVLFSISGCSWLFVTEAPPNHADLPYFECTTSKVAPIVDTGFGVLYAADAVLIAAIPMEEYDSGLKIPLVGISAVIAAIEIASAVYGFRCTSKCKKAKEQLALRMQSAPSGQYLPVQQPYELYGLCNYDSQCKGDRICESGRCVSPPAPPPPIRPPPAPAQPPPPQPVPPQPPAAPAQPPPAGPAPPPTAQVPATTP